MLTGTTALRVSGAASGLGRFSNTGHVAFGVWVFLEDALGEDIRKFFQRNGWSTADVHPSVSGRLEKFQTFSA